MDSENPSIKIPPQIVERIECMQESEGALQDILNCIYDALIIHDMEGNLILWNTSFLHLYQITSEQANSLNIQNISSPEIPMNLAHDYQQRAFRGDQDVLFEWKAFRPTVKMEFDVEVALRPITYRGKSAIVALVRDNSQRKLAIEEREKLLHEIQRHKNELERMVYVFGHDMRAPLVNIQGFSSELQGQIEELMQHIPKESEGELSSLVHSEIANSIRFITSSTKKLALMINGMLQIGRLGQARLEMQQIDTHSLVKTVLESVEWQIKESHAEVVLDPLPACKGDPQWIGQVFGNLIDNALKYRHPDRKPRIHIEGSLQKRFCIFTISDNGMGIRKEQLAKIWELFYRAATKQGPAGEGIGLTMVRQIVERHGGQITCESVEGEGTSFILILPIPAPCPGE